MTVLSFHGLHIIYNLQFFLKKHFEVGFWFDFESILPQIKVA